MIFSVNDRGNGISKKEQELFQSADQEKSFGTNEEKGTGIGLILSKEFIKANDGELWIEKLRSLEVLGPGA